MDPVTNHAESASALSDDLDASSKKDLGTTIEDQSGSILSFKGEKINKVDSQEGDHELCSLYTHMEGDPPQAIITTLGQEAVYVKTHLLAILPEFWGKSCDNPYEFLHEFCKIYKSQ